MLQIEKMISAMHGCQRVISHLKHFGEKYP